MHPFRASRVAIPLLFACLLTAGQAVGQQRIAGEYYFSSLGIKDGLSQGMIFCILQDAKGFLWFATKEGLNRYDGYSFKVYRNIPGDPTSLADNQIFSMTQDHTGRIWIGTRTQGLQLFDPVREVFTPVPIPAGTSSSRTVDQAIHHLNIDREGYLWIGGWKRLLARLDTRHRSLVKLKRSMVSYAHDRRFISNETFTMSLTDSGHAAIVVQDGVWCYRAPRFGFQKALDWKELGLRFGDDGDEITTAVADGKGSYWVSARMGERALLLRIDWNSRRITDTLRFMYGGADLVARAITFGPDGNLYCSGSNYFIRCELDRRVYTVTPPMPGQTGRLQGDVSDMLFDRSGNLWIGTAGLGLFSFNPRTLAFHADIQPLHEALFGTELRAFVSYIRKKTGDPFKQLQTVYPVRAPDGSVWCGAVHFGLLHYDPVTGTVRSFGVSQQDPHRFLMLRLGLPFIDSKGRVWIGNTQGLSRLVDRPEQWEHYFFSKDGPDLLRREDNVNCYFEDGDGTIWLGTVSTGMARFHPETGEFDTYQSNLSDSVGLSSNHVLCITPDPAEPERYLWIGTDGGGLNLFDKKHGTFRRFGLKDGLPNMVIYGILPDTEGTLWMSSNNGISRLDPSRMTFTNYTRRDGLQDNEFNRTEYASIPPMLYFGGVRGHNAFDPRNIRRNKTVPEIVLTGLRIFNRPVTDRGILPRAVPYTSSITLAHDQNMLTFEFAALDYTSPKMNFYRYRLEGLDEHWIDAGNERTATYTYLDPGEYTFHVIGSNNHGVWNTEGAVLRITILSPWWQTAWAWTGYGILLIALIATVDRLQRRRVIARERQRSLMRESELRAEAAELEARVVRAEQERSEQEIRVAAEMQKRIIPQSLPDIPGYAIGGRNIPANEIGGDYYDCIPLGEGRYALVMADVTGKGIPAALLVNSLHASLLVQLDADRPLEDLTLRLNEFIYRISTPSTFITFIIAILHAPSGTIEMINAGHNPAMVQSSDGQVDVMKEHGLPLGCSVDITLYKREVRVLMPGEGLLLYTDGIPEAMDAGLGQFGQDALERFLADCKVCAPDRLIDALVERLAQHRSEACQSDDLTMLFLRRKKTP